MFWHIKIDIDLFSVYYKMSKYLRSLAKQTSLLYLLALQQKWIHLTRRCPIFYDLPNDSCYVFLLISLPNRQRNLVGTCIKKIQVTKQNF